MDDRQMNVLENRWIKEYNPDVYVEIVKPMIILIFILP